MPSDVSHEDAMLGRWWMPGKNEFLLGDLLINGKNIRLKVSSAKEKTHIWDRRRSSYHNIIFGELIDGSSVTLTECYEYSRTQTSSGFTQYQLYCEKAIFGLHCTDIEHTFCNSVSIEIPNLDIWLGEKHYQSAFSDGDDEYNDFPVPDSSSKKNYIAYDLHETYWSDNIDEYQFKFSSLAFPNFLAKDFSLLSRYSVEISSKTGAQFSDLMQEVELCVWLFSLLYGKYIEPNSINVSIISKERSIPARVMPPFRKENINRSVTEMALDMKDCREKISYFIKKSREVFKIYNEVCSITIFRKRSQQDDNIDSIRGRFLDIIHAIEGISLKSEDSNIIEKSEFKKFKTRVLGIIDEMRIAAEISEMKENCSTVEDIETFKEKVNSNISHLNERKLEGKISGFFSLFLIRTLSCLKLSSSDIPRIVKTRNYYAHMSNKKQKGLLDIGEMASLNQRLITLITIFFMKEIGIEEVDAVYGLRGTDEHRGRIDIDEFNSPAHTPK